MYYSYPAGTLPPASDRRLTNAHMLTTVLMASRSFGGNLVGAKHYMERRWDQNWLDKSGFTRRLHALTDTQLALFTLVGEALKHLYTEARNVLNFFPVAVCNKMRHKHLSRISHAVSC